MGGRYTSRRGSKKTRRPFKAQSKSRAGWVLYLMVHFPLVFFVKIGITGRTATARANDIDEAVWGVPIPVCVVFVPGAYMWEQMLHRICRPIGVRFYDGDGASEWFLLPAAIPAVAFMLFVWGLYFWGVSCATNWDALGWYMKTLAVLGGWILDLIR